ncbi:polysaccharide biosynthesis tyrosine autokinase [Nostoc sp. 106C]|uniref:GumC family protein n=1 Tax=Nostoc sp. 106C TaxID=1932667 RepID=UPI000A378EAE|nr:polysaccharide biosynthesis tyrosine autokinase [Nostoc sp. 106C]OUL27229.1 lipopolysaccharide biosynthesis protein [Nostoc sp. RF31YmG]OUL33270.1 lipopolysaccharide biosynthesis protein [Nostoc sp. 106C]
MESHTAYLTFDKYWQILKRRWIRSLGVFIPVFLLSLLASSLKKPSYEAEGKLLFQRTNTISSLTGVGAEIGKLEAVAQDQKTNPLNTEAEIIRSVPLVQETITRLVLKNDKGMVLKSKEFLEQLTVKEIKGTDILQVSYRDRYPEKSAKVVNTVMNAYLEHNVSSRRKEAAAARQFLQKELPNAELIVRKAEAELAKFKDKNRVVSLQEEATKAVEVITDLQKQLGESQSQIANVNAQAEDIRKQLRMNSQQAVATTSLSQSSGVQDILKEIQQVESQLAARRTILQNSHPEIINLETRLDSLKRILQQRIKQVVGTTQPQVNGNLQIGALQQQLTTELIRLESTRLGLIGQVAALSNLQAAYKQRLNTLPRLEQQQRQLERKVQASQSTYLLMLQKLQESQIAENQNVGNASLISEAQVPDQPISSPMVSYLSAGLLAILAAVATMYILEVRDKSIKTVDEAKDLLGLTLLGVIPSFGKSKKYTRGNEELELYSSRLIVRDTPRSPISEAYRMLRANLKFMSADKELKVIVITSSVPGEGKSTVAANLALAMAQMERKVLLVDADLHRPVQHKIWDLTNTQGLSNVIVGQAEIKTAINKVMDSMDNLDVLTAGVVPPSPASLLDSKRMASLMQSFAVNYDFVIIDAPSLNVAADAATLGQMADGVLFVVRPGVVDSVHAAIACDILEKSGQNVLGQVVNAVIPQNESHSYYYFTKESDFQEYSVATTRK